MPRNGICESHGRYFFWELYTVVGFQFPLQYMSVPFSLLCLQCLLLVVLFLPFLTGIERITKLIFTFLIAKDHSHMYVYILISQTFFLFWEFSQAQVPCLNGSFIFLWFFVFEFFLYPPRWYSVRWIDGKDASSLGFFLP